MVMIIYLFIQDSPGGGGAAVVVFSRLDFCCSPCVWCPWIFLTCGWTGFSPVRSLSVSVSLPFVILAQDDCAGLVVCLWQVGLSQLEFH